jgi:mannose-6-phosphate isomerase-like protein (cupin superfamily)
MEFISKTQSAYFTNGPTCTGYGFSFSDKGMDIAIVTVNGKYPEKGYVLNEISREIAYILKGGGKLVMGDGAIKDVQPGDALIILPGEKYRWEGDNLEMLMPCSPAFDPAQHKQVE